VKKSPKLKPKPLFVKSNALPLLWKFGLFHKTHPVSNLFMINDNVAHAALASVHVPMYVAYVGPWRRGLIVSLSPRRLELWVVRSNPARVQVVW
jgi:hypothetical protein